MTTARLVERIEYITPDNLVYDLFGGQRVVMSWQNFGMPPINYLSDRGPFQHGRTIRDFRLNQRIITLRQHERAHCRIDWWCNEALLIDIFRPNRSSSVDAGTLRITRPDDVQIEIGARILRGPSGNWDATGALLPSSLEESLQLVCDDPIWRLPVTTTVTATIIIVDSCLPICVPYCLGDDIIDEAFDVQYCGTWDGDVLTIEITGPVILPVITNVTTDKQIKLNYTVSAGEKVTINIRPNIVTVKNNSDVNLIGVIDEVSDLVTFTLAAIGSQTSNGINEITMTGSGGVTGDTQISMTFDTRHISAFAPCVDCP